MKSFLLAVLLPLLFLSAEYNEVSARKKLKCYVRQSEYVEQSTASCEGNDVVCFADTFWRGAAKSKACGERSKLISDCEENHWNEGAEGIRLRCVVCETDLCNKQPLYWG